MRGKLVNVHTTYQRSDSCNLDNADGMLPHRGKKG